MDIRTVGVAGLGLQGREITACLLGHGFRVVGYTRSRATHDLARQYIAEGVRDLVEHGDCPASLGDAWAAHYEAAESCDAFGPCDFVIETIIEEMGAKQQVFDQIEASVGPAVPIASNTSSLPITLLQRQRKRPERFVGMHWGEPAQVARFLEVVRGEQTSDEVIQAAIALGRKAGKEPSLVKKDVPAFIANRIGYAIYREALSLLELGVGDVETIDRSFRNTVGIWATIGGPFREMDLTGGPVVYAPVMKGVLPHLSNSREVPQVIRDLAAGDARGITNGRGFYNYTPQEAKDWERLFRENAWAVRTLMDHYFPAEDP
jgi:3-hydroxybutyryl-CoA dehydrogenase